MSPISLTRVRQSLKTRITLATVILFVVGIVTLSVYSSRILRDEMTVLLGAQQFATVSILAEDADKGLSERLKWLETVASNITAPMLDEPVALQDFFAQRLILPRLFNGGGIIYDVKGEARAFSLPVSVRIGAQDQEGDAVSIALKEGKANIGTASMDKKRGTPVFAMAVPIRDPGGKVIGAFAGVTNLASANFLDKIQHGHVGQSGGYLLVSPKHRQIIAATDSNRVMEALPPEGVIPALDRYIAGREGTDIFISPHGVEVLTAVKRLPTADWYLASVLPTEEAFAPINLLQSHLRWATICVAVLVAGLIWWLLHRQLLPLISTARTLIQRAESEATPEALPVTRQDEIGQLVVAFNRLLDSLTKRDMILRSILQVTQDGFWRVDLDGRLIDVNATYCKQSGFSREELIGINISVLEASESRQEVEKHFRYLIETGNDLFETRHRRKDGSLWDVEVSSTYSENSGALVCVFLRDITERKQHEAQNQLLQASLKELAIRDALTGLYNRRYLNETLPRELARAEREGLELAIVMIDIDHFKQVNDTHGHAAGDTVLKALAVILESGARESDLVCRFGGEEFLIMLPGINADQALERTETWRLDFAATTTRHGEAVIVATISAGIALFPTHGDNAQALIANADQALYASKNRGRNRVTLFAT